MNSSIVSSSESPLKKRKTKYYSINLTTSAIKSKAVTSRRHELPTANTSFKQTRSNQMSRETSNDSGTVIIRKPQSRNNSIHKNFIKSNIMNLQTTSISKPRDTGASTDRVKKVNYSKYISKKLKDFMIKLDMDYFIVKPVSTINLKIIC